MKKFSFETVTLVLLTISGYAVAQNVQARYDASCGYLANKIHCFGGATSIEVKKSDTSMITLDILNLSQSTADELKTKWTYVTTDTRGADVRPRDGPQSVLLPDGETMIISGGFTPGNNKLNSQAISFNAKSMSWAEYGNYNEVPYGVRQIYHAPSTYVPDHGIAFYGGLETNYNKSFSIPGVNVTAYQDDKSDIRNFGYLSLTFLDIRNPSNPWSVYPSQKNTPTYLGRYQTSVFDAKSNRIFYFGGKYQDPPSLIVIYYTFKNSVTFDMTKGEWGSQDFNGVGPTTRTGHSTTLIGPDKRDILVYGGHSEANNFLPNLDYCFTLNLDSYQWTQQSLQGPDNPILIRTQHSAVPVNNDTVFIVFGKDPINVPTLSLLILNVSDTSRITLLNSFVDPNVPAVDPTTKLPYSENHTLSKEAIIGVGVGSALGGIIISFLIFFLIKKRKIKRDAVGQNEEPSDMEVDWDKIETKYVPAPTKPFGYTTEASENNSTMIDRSTMLFQGTAQTNNKLQRPNVFDGDWLTDTSDIRLLQKPDGRIT
ncbi:uncharacterized protein EV154DRAFT_494626 [Mucor mucedo]|uniref:uncharacterized protein n=1 Tax=Mucor mucedo TaxID=29922 RepID=UPI00221E4050|nr:uncharacterized protein EV154DRAFT_494626 [Mucor mucedo]KAI7895694.1 hypothetical protein EV154DRAFT_494626 [Mucor mucedo]